MVVQLIHTHTHARTHTHAHTVYKQRDIEKNHKHMG